MKVFGTHIGTYTFYEGGRGDSADIPMILKTVDSTNFSFGRLLGPSIRGKETGRVDDLSLVMFPWQLIYVKGVFDQKRLKMNKSSNTSQNFRITAKALKLLEVILHFIYFSEK